MIGPLQDSRPLFHYVIGISGVLPYLTCLLITGDFFRLRNTFARLYNATASPASRFRSVGSLAISYISSCFSLYDNSLLHLILETSSINASTITSTSNISPNHGYHCHHYKNKQLCKHYHLCNINSAIAFRTCCNKTISRRYNQYRHEDESSATSIEILCPEKAGHS